MKNCASTLINQSLLIGVFGRDSPNAEAWEEYRDLAVQALETGFDAFRNLTISDGGAPDVRQRGEINARLAGRTAPAAIISDSMLVRGAVTALSWINPKIRAFGPEQIDKAIAYLAIGATTLAEVRSAITALQESLPGKSTTAERVLKRLETLAVRAA